METIYFMKYMIPWRTFYLLGVFWTSHQKIIWITKDNMSMSIQKRFLVSSVVPLSTFDRNDLRLLTKRKRHENDNLLLFSIYCS